jgi:hypothetical protein
LLRRATKASNFRRLTTNRGQTPEPPLLLRSLSTTHAFVFSTTNLLRRSETARKEISQAAALGLQRIACSKARSLSPCPPQLPLAITFSLLNLFFTQDFDLRLPIVTETVFIESPTRSNAHSRLACPVIITWLVLDNTPAIYSAAYHAG